MHSNPSGSTFVQTMYNVIKTYRRPSKDVPFFFEIHKYSPEMIQYMKEKYRDTGIIRGGNREYQEDGLVVVNTTTFSSKDDFISYISDPVIFDNFIVPQVNYNKENGILIDDSEAQSRSLVAKRWKTIDPRQYFAGLQIPETWASLEDFVQWYLDNRMPIMPPWNAGVTRSDDATATCLFRHGNYQVELYLEFPDMSILPHSHPDMEVMVMTLGGTGLDPRIETEDNDSVSRTWGIISEKLMPGEIHGGDTGTRLGYGTVFFAFERWYNQEEVSSAAVQWVGGLQGPIQEELIRSKRKEAHVEPGYANIRPDKSMK